MDFARETLFDVIEDVEPLLQLHYEELCINRDVVKLAPRWDVYAALEQAGAFVIYTAREAGELVGYSAYFVNQNMHYADLTVGMNDVFYIRDDYRRGTTAMRFLKHCEAELKSIGVRKLVYHCKAANNFAPILHRLGFRDEEVMTAKLI